MKCEEDKNVGEIQKKWKGKKEKIYGLKQKGREENPPTPNK